jgi:vacuolar-type H+-ATPase subunit I/STV1
MDPAWGNAENKLQFINSVKMKLSVIFGVGHMTLGILCKGTNTIFFGQYTAFFTEVVAGIVILWGLFGWMDVLIIAKFFKTYDIDYCPDKQYSADQIKMLENDQSITEPQTCQGDIDNRKTPGIINIMITTVFAFGAYDEEKHQDAIVGRDEK